MKILIVEDTRSSLLIISRFVERFGASALPTDCGEQAIEIFQRERPDMVLLDIMLPDIDGFTVARRLRGLEEDGGWTPIIFMSSLNKDEDIARGIAAGGDDYLIKPISEIVLGAKMRAMQRIIQMRTSLLVLARELDTTNRELKRLSASDGLTGIPNRRQFDQYISREWRRARRNKNSMALIMCDVDYFKSYNDNYGHQAGDDCLRRVAAAIEDSLERASDVVARYGGEEFAVVLPETEIGGCHFLAEKLRQAILELKIPHANSPHGQITVSFGIAAGVPDEHNSQDELIHAADRALYQAKHQGRDCVSRADSLDKH